ncbi:MAG: hypothetical protein IJW62_08210, partial [Clostridia bacterium]|nr:hypothetical protein [Clostridia bacterium]
MKEVPLTIPSRTLKKPRKYLRGRIGFGKTITKSVRRQVFAAFFRSFGGVPGELFSKSSPAYNKVRCSTEGRGKPSQTPKF